MENQTAQKIMDLSKERTERETYSATPTVEALLKDKSFLTSINKATHSRISAGNCLSILNAMANLEILKEIKKLNENLQALLIVEEEVVEEEVKDTKKKK